MRNVQVRSPGEVTRGRRLAESGGQAQVETRVLHAPDVPGDVVREELTGRRGLVKEQVVGVLVVPVDRPCEPLPEQGEVRAHVPGAGGLPLDVRVDAAGAGGADVLVPELHLRLRVAELIRGHVQVVGEGLIPGLAPRGPELQVRNRGHVPEEGFLGDAPAHRHGREIPPLVPGPEARGPIAPDAGRHEVAVVDVVSGPTEERNELRVLDVEGRDGRDRSLGDPGVTKDVGQELPSEDRRIIAVRLGVRIAAREIELARAQAHGRRIVGVRIEHRVHLCVLGAKVRAVGAVLGLQVDVVWIEGHAVGIRNVVAQVDCAGEPAERREPGEVVFGLEVAHAAVSRAVIQRAIQDFNRVVGRRQGIAGPVVVAGAAGRIKHRLGRPHLRGVVEHTAGRELVVVARALQVGFQVEVIVVQPLVVIDRQGHALSRRAFEDAVLVEIPEGQTIVVGGSGSRQRDVVLLAHPRLVHQPEPVGVGRAQLCQSRGVVLRHRRPKLRRVQHGREPGDRCGGERAAVLHPPPPLTRLRGDQHHAVRGVGAVDRRGGSVLEHGDAGDVVRVDEVQRIAARRESSPRAGAQRHTVHHVEGLAEGGHRRGTADADGEAAAGLVVVHHLHTWDLVFDQLLRARDGAGVEVLRAQLAGGGRYVAGPLGPIPDHHHRREVDGPRRHCEVHRDRIAARDRDRLRRRRVPDEPRAHGVRTRGYVAHDIAAVCPGHGSSLPDRNRDAGEWLLRGGVGDAPADRPRGLLRAERRHPQHPQERPNTAQCSSHTRPLKLKVSPPCNTYSSPHCRVVKDARNAVGGSATCRCCALR